MQIKYGCVNKITNKGIFKSLICVLIITLIMIFVPMKLFALENEEYTISETYDIRIPLSKSSNGLMSRNKRYLYNDKKPEIKEGFFYNDKYFYNVIWYTHKYEVVLEIHSSKRNYNEDDIDFGIYCCIMSFIDDHDHTFEDFLETERKVQFNINGTNNVLTTVKFTLYD